MNRTELGDVDAICSFITTAGLFPIDWLRLCAGSFLCADGTPHCAASFRREVVQRVPMSPLQQALALTSAAFLLGIAMIVGGLASRPDMPVHIVMSRHASPTTDSMGVSGVGYDDQGDHRTASEF